MFWHSVLLFLRGKLFQSPRHVLRQSAVGALITMLLCVALVKLLDTIWLGVLISAVLGGALQPLLFKNLKYN
jgi:hypothetical protein